MPQTKNTVDTILDEVINPFAGGDPITDEPDQQILDQPEPKKIDNVDDDDDDVLETEVTEVEEETEEAETEETEEEETETETEESDEEPEDDAATEEEPDEEETDSKKPDTVPFQRLDKEIQRRQALQKKLEAAEKALNEKSVSIEDIDLGDTVANMFDQALEGNVEQANAAMKDILMKVAKATRESVLSEIDTRIDNRTVHNEVSRTVEEVVAEMETTYPALNSKSDQFDQGLTKRALGFHQAYMDEGIDRATALEMAVKDAITLLRPDLLKTTAPVVKKDKQQEVKAKQKSEAIKKNVEAAAKQAPKLQGRRESVDAKSIKDMTDEEFKQLSREEIARLRGDIL